MYLFISLFLNLYYGKCKLDPPQKKKKKKNTMLIKKCILLEGTQVFE